MKKINDKVQKENKKGLKEIANFKTLKIIFIVAVCVIVLELLLMLIMYVGNERKINYVDTVNDVSLIDNKYYLLAGSSNFNNSKFNDKKTYKYTSSDGSSKNKTIIAEQAKLVKYDLDMNVIWEKTFDSDYDAVYYDAINVSDGYIAVGSYIYEYKQIELRTRDGLIVKYDKDGNFQWFKNYQILGDTEFYKVIDVSDGFIAIGQSIYENMEIGNHIEGGGIIVKYDYEGNVIWKNNFGGNKSGSFNDIVSVKDGYIVCGKDGANYGLIAKFSKDGQIKWHYSTLNVAITDMYGFNAMELYDNKLYIASSINYSNEKNEKGEPIYRFKGCVYVYDLNGNCIKKYRSDSGERFEDLIVDKNGITAIGSTNKEFDSYKSQTGAIVKFELDGKELINGYYGGNNYDVLSTIIDNGSDYLIFGHSNSFGNKKDYMPIYRNISKDNKVIYEKN